MDRDSTVSPQTHYHIRWVSPLKEMDWERHDTRAQAEEAAKQLALPDEKYIIEQFGEDCVQCRTLPHKNSSTSTETQR